MKFFIGRFHEVLPSHLILHFEWMEGFDDHFVGSFMFICGNECVSLLYACVFMYLPCTCVFDLTDVRISPFALHCSTVGRMWGNHKIAGTCDFYKSKHDLSIMLCIYFLSCKKCDLLCVC